MQVVATFIKSGLPSLKSWPRRRARPYRGFVKVNVKVNENLKAKGEKRSFAGDGGSREREREGECEGG